MRCSVSIAALVVASGPFVASPALGANLPAKARPMTPVSTTYSWDGSFIGIHGGWGGATFGGLFNDGDSTVFGSGLKSNGALFGLHAGYNWDRGVWVIGIEGDVSFMNWKQNSFSAGSSDFAVSKVNNLASIRARIGIPVTNDRRGLLYLTGGAAWANAEVTVYDAVVGDPTGTPQTLKFGSIGGVVGGGLEWIFSPQWRGRIEGLYYMFDTSKPITIAAANPGDHFKLEHIWSVRAGVSWYFSQPR
jgi:outer membrane immunogenic protein